MFSTWSLDRIQRTSAALSQKKMVWSFALRTLFIAAVFLFIGVTSLSYVFSALSMGLVGLWFAVYGIAMLRFSADKAMLIGDRSGIVAFIASIALIACEMVIDPPKPGKLPVALPSVFFVIMGFAFVYFTYKRVVRSSPPLLSGDDEAQFKAALTAVLQANHQTDSRIVQLVINNATIRGELANAMIVLTADRGNEVRALLREDFELVPDLNGKTRKGIPMRVRMEQNWGSGTIDELSYQRYQAWKARTEL